MIKDVISATYRGEYKIQITFEDGKSGLVDFKEYINKGGVFNKFSPVKLTH